MTDTMTPDQLKNEVMAHRYLYYVLSEPVLPDSVYDSIEREARRVCPADSVVQKAGSSLLGSYTARQIAIAMKFLS